MTESSERGGWAARRLWWALTLAAIISLTAVLAAVRLRRPPDLQTPKFHAVMPGGPSRSSAAQRLRAGAAGANVIIVVLDAAAASHFASFGYKRDTTPNLAKFHSQGVLLTEAYAAAASTKPSVASLFTAQFPDTHGALALPAHLSSEGATLAECFTRAGYATAAFSASPSVSATLGYGRGFGSFHEVFRDAGLEPTTLQRRSPGTLPVDAALVLRSVVDWLQAHGDERFFMYIHFREPHYPYVVPPSFHVPFLDLAARRPQKLMYDASLAYVDSIFARLLEELDARGLLAESVVVTMADHGEAFSEHGKVGHSSTAYTEMTHVPVAFHLPARSGAVPQRRSEIFCLTDIMPTLLDLLGMAPPTTMQGRSRLALLTGEQEETPAFAVSRALGEDHSGGLLGPDQVSYAFRVPRYTLLLADEGKRVELYDRDADPGELHDIAALQPDLARALRAQFEEWADSQRGRPVVLPGGRVYSAEGKESDLDEATRRQLKALGYLR